MNHVYLSLGSNIGNRLQYINNCVNELKKFSKIIDSSFLYETKPMYNQNQDSFLNAVLKIETKQNPFELLKSIKQIEQKFGRKFSQIVNQPRPIDVDIILFNDLVIDDPKLKIPHIGLENRQFVLKPLIDIQQNLINYRTNQKILDSYINLLNSEGDNQINQVYGIKDKIFNINGKALSMKILNITNDSFYNQQQHAYDFLQQQNFENLYDILDIGAESTKLGSQTVPYQEEIQRLENIFEKLKNSNATISLDTRKVIQKFQNQIHIINDVSAGNFDQNMFDFISQLNKPYVLMHQRGQPSDMDQFAQYDSYQTIIDEMIQKINTLRSKQVPRWNIIIDPGIGFAKKQQHNLEILKNLEKFKNLNYPLLVGFSNKKFLKKIFEEKNLQAANSTLANICIQKGANIIRFHDDYLLPSLEISNFIYRQ